MPGVDLGEGSVVTWADKTSTSRGAGVGEGSSQPTSWGLLLVMMEVRGVTGEEEEEVTMTETQGLMEV